MNKIFRIAKFQRPRIVVLAYVILFLFIVLGVDVAMIRTNTYKQCVDLAKFYIKLMLNSFCILCIFFILLKIKSFFDNVLMH